MASSHDMIVHDNPYHRAASPHRSQAAEWLERAYVPLAHRLHNAFGHPTEAHSGTHPIAGGGVNTKQAVIATAGTIAAIAAARYFATPTSKIPMGVEILATAAGIAGTTFSEKNDPAKAAYIGVGAVGAMALVSRGLTRLPPYHAATPAVPGAAVHGEFGAEDPIIRAARAL